MKEFSVSRGYLFSQMCSAIGMVGKKSTKAKVWIQELCTNTLIYCKSSFSDVVVKPQQEAYPKRTAHSFILSGMGKSI